MAIIGAVLGDIAGSQYEFTKMRPEDLDWKNCELFTKKCRFTDDTVLTIGTKKAILEDKENPNFGLWYQKMGIAYPKAGYGGMFRRYLQDPDRKPYNSFGNGSAMRVSPVVDLYDDHKKIMEMAKLSAVCTHNHPEGAKGAIVTAACAKIAQETKSKQSIYEFAQKFYGDSDKYKYPVTMSLDEMRKIYRWDVTCQGSVPAAIRCVLEADSYEEFLRNVFSLPCDMDTLGAIGGGIAEELFGLKDIEYDVILQEYLTEFLFETVMWKE